MTIDTTIINWSDPREVQTKYGPRIVREGTPTQAFWTAWKQSNIALKADGYSITKKDGAWRVIHWGQIDNAVIEQRKAVADLSRAADAQIDVPCPRGRAYLPYQRAGIKFALQRPAVLVGEEMGLGKTIEAIGVINALPDIEHILIICPASLKNNWRNELQRWLVRDYKIEIVNGHFPAEGIAIINYDVLGKHINAIHSVEWDLVIADEAHYLKNQKAQRTKLVFGHQPHKSSEKAIPPIRAKRKLLLTGTPIVNRPVELFPLIHYLDPAAWPNFFGFAKRYCNAHQNRYGWDFSGASHLDELQRKLRESGLMIRRLKKDVLTELPAKRRQVIELPITDTATRNAVQEEWDAYRVREDKLAELRAAVERAEASDDPEEYKKAINALRQGQAVAFEEMSRQRKQTALAKLPSVIDRVREALEDDGKLVVFAHHHEVVDALAAELGNAAVVVDGRVAPDKRQGLVDKFQTDPTTHIFIGGIYAAGVGLTLTAASHVVFAELDWVPGVITQAEDRLHRIGQQNSVLVQHLVLEGSLDAVMAQRMIDKQEVIDSALDERHSDPVYQEFAVFEPKAKAEAPVADQKQKPMTEAEIEAAHNAMRFLAARCDGAFSLDGQGFNKMDSSIGKSLANAPYLSQKQAALAAKLARKYRRQLEG